MRHISAASALAFLLGCPTTTDAPPPVPEAASYQLRIDSIDSVRGDPYWDDQPSVLSGAEVRLDLFETEGGLAARVARAWGGARPYSVVESADGLVLEPVDQAILVVGVAEGGSHTSTASIDRIVLDASVVDGAIEWTGAFAVGAIENANLGDYFPSAAVQATGFGRVDDVAPEIRIANAGAVLLPWDPISVSFSEPIDVEQLHERLPAGATTDHAIGADPLITDATVLPGAHAALTWWPAGTVRIDLSAGVSDLVGSESEAAAFEAERVADVEPVTGLDFESGTAEVDTWGGDPSEEAPPCPSGTGCLQIVRYPTSDAGLFARLVRADGGAITRVQLNLRAVGIDWHGNRPFAVRFEVAHDPERGSSHRAEVIHEEDVPVRLVAGETFDSGVVTIGVELPDDADAIGIAIRFVDPQAHSTAAGGPGSGPPIAPLETIAIAVDDITVE